MNVRIVYPRERQRKRGSYSYSKKNSSTTGKVRKEFCPFCHMLVAPADIERRTFLVYGKKVPFKLSDFEKWCYQFGWEVPPVFKEESYDIEPWLILRAQAIANLPIKNIGEQWVAITSFAADIGLKTNFAQAVARP